MEPTGRPDGLSSVLRSHNVAEQNRQWALSSDYYTLSSTCVGHWKVRVEQVSLLYSWLAFGICLGVVYLGLEVKQLLVF